MILFNEPCYTGEEEKYLMQVLANKKLCGDGSFTKLSSAFMEQKFGAKKVLLTTSCSHALDMSAILANIKEGDEVIMPSYTFVSTANAFVLRGANIVFVDIRPDTMNLNEKLIESAITSKTKAIVPVHYAGVSCEMDTILALAKKYNLLVIEDAAQGVMARYKERYLGTIGDIGAYSFHETKNYVCGEGGAIVINNPSFAERAEIIREKGTDRSRFFRGQVDKYSWVDIGSSYLPSEFNAAYLYGQLEQAEEINNRRLTIWNTYYEGLKSLVEKQYLTLPFIPETCTHNAHMFYIKLKDLQQRTEMIEFLKKNEILSVFHYIPLHSAKAGLEYGRFHGEDVYTTIESERLLRLPMYYALKDEQVSYIIDKVNAFFDKK
jgi:dTDP-4-amino-4,6-dideoxygalactose transaminase